MYYLFWIFINGKGAYVFNQYMENLQKEMHQTNNSDYLGSVLFCIPLYYLHKFFISTTHWSYNKILIVKKKIEILDNLVGRIANLT